MPDRETTPSAVLIPRPAVEKKKAGSGLPAWGKDLAATYSRASYTGTTIGNAAFDGRVRDGIGSDHSFMATKNALG